MSYKPSNDLIEYFAGQALGGLVTVPRHNVQVGPFQDVGQRLIAEAFKIGEAMAQEAMKRRAER